MPITYPHIVSWIADVIFPKRCLLCRTYTETYACLSCLNKISLTGQFSCISCQKQIPEGRTCAFCRDACAVDQLFAAAEFKNKEIQLLIKACKYQFIQDLIPSLSIILNRYIKQLSQRGYRIFERNPLLVPVPLSRRRLNWRGFNQSELIAKDIADRYQLQTNREALVRVGHRSPQADIESHEQRKENSLGQFDCTQDLSGRAILLIDDVCTSGATLNECAKVLKQKGASFVGALVIAKG